MCAVSKTVKLSSAKEHKGKLEWVLKYANAMREWSSFDGYERESYAGNIDNAPTTRS